MCGDRGARLIKRTVDQDDVGGRGAVVTYDLPQQKKAHARIQWEALPALPTLAEPVDRVSVHAPCRLAAGRLTRALLQLLCLVAPGAFFCGWRSYVTIAT